MDEFELLAHKLAGTVVTKSEMATIEFGTIFDRVEHRRQVTDSYVCTVVALKMFYISDMDMLVQPGEQVDIKIDYMNVVDITRTT